MAQFSFLSKQDLIQICNHYEIVKIREFCILSGGSENTNYKITCDNYRYVLTIFEQKTIERVKLFAELLLYLKSQGFRTTEVIGNANGEYISIWNEKPIMLKYYINGSIIQNLSCKQLESIGVEMGKLHKLDCPHYLPTMLDYGIENFQEVSNYSPNSHFESWLLNIREFISPYLQLELPKSIIHSDIFFNNVIISNDKDSVTIVDFEEATYYYRIFDIGMAIIGLCAENSIVNLQKAKHLINGYKNSIQLTQQELAALKPFTVYAGAAMTFWRHRNFNLTKPDPTMFEHYKGLQVLTDYMLNQESSALT